MASNPVPARSSQPVTPERAVLDLRSMSFGGCGVRHEFSSDKRAASSPKSCETDRLFDCCHNDDSRLKAGLKAAEFVGLLTPDEHSAVRLLIAMVSDGFFLLDEVAQACGSIEHQRARGFRSLAAEHDRFLAAEGIPGTFDTVTRAAMSARIDPEQRQLGAIRRDIGVALAEGIEEFLRSDEAGVRREAKERLLTTVAQCRRRSLETGLIAYMNGE